MTNLKKISFLYILVDDTIISAECKERIPNKETGPTELRVITGGSAKGQGQVNKPVLYLGLNRLYPINDETKLNILNTELSKDYTNEYSTLMREITGSNEKIESSGVISNDTSGNKYIGLQSLSYRYVSASVGQSNLGQIITSLLSFKKLKEEIGEEYEGGLLLIDELEASLFPSVQNNLVGVLRKYAKKYELQIVFTTHSMEIVEELYKNNLFKNPENDKVIYLTNIDDKIVERPDMSKELIRADLSSTVIGKNRFDKMKIYVEDDEAKHALNNILGMDLKKQIDVVSIFQGHNTLYHLAKLPEFKKIIFCLDGDQHNDSNLRAKNVFVLPGQRLCPEEEMYKYLKNMSANHIFWNNTENYTKETFGNDTRTIENFNNEEKKSEIKRWVKSSSTINKLGKLRQKLWKAWVKDNKDDVNCFRDKVKAFFKEV